MWSRFGSGIAVSGRWIRKCPGVSASKSAGSLLSGVSGRELRIASIWTSTVWNSSYSRVCSPIVRLNSNLKLFTADSQRPPKFGERAGMNLNSMLSFAVSRMISSSNC
uniref:(northern house mosquito) hypothetical protein n=1 Tax=Culex pipiens TaxID=7175 RepID=A0A8D8JU27_CULPI